MSNIQLIRLVGGLDIIAEHTEMPKGMVLIENPVAIHFVNKGGKPILFMESWIPTHIMKESSVEVHSRNILFYADLEEFILVNYMAMVDKIHEAKDEFKPGLVPHLEEDQEEDRFGGINILEGLDMEGEILQ